MPSDDDEPSVLNLGFGEAPTHFESASQKARIWTEQWVLASLYCPNCGAGPLDKFANNRPAADFFCGNCEEEFELKSQKGRFGGKVVDGAYATMRARVTARNNPNLILLNYDLGRREATDVFVVPKHFFVADIIEERKPLAATARRAGWVGCNILIGRIPAAGKIALVRDRLVRPRNAVLAAWRETLFLRDQALSARGWLIEVMKAVDDIGRPEFSLADVYRFEDRIAVSYPNNRNIRAKIRQQLQVLRDQGYLEFQNRGVYRLRAEQSPAT